MDTQSAMIDLFMNLGALIGPILGGFLHSKICYRHAMDVWMMSLIVITFIYAIFNCGFDIFKKSNQ